MKNITFVMLSLLIALCISCEGPQGLAGFDGQNGLDGSEFENSAFEITRSFALNNEGVYSVAPETYPLDLNLLKSDVLLIYRLEKVVDGLDVWRQLPQPFFSDEGLLFYNFDFTQDDYSLFLEPDFDTNLVTNDLIRNQTFRVLVVPANILSTSKVDVSDINAMMGLLGIKDIVKY